MVRRYTPMRANVGTRRTSGNTGDNEALHVLNIRAQMKAITDEFASWVDHMTKEGSFALKEAMEPTFKWSQNMVPVRTGELKASGYLEARELSTGFFVEIGYGRAGHPHYAPVVHEMVEVPHKPPTQAKFLEIPLTEDLENIKARFYRKLQEASGTNG